jgi:HEPN domain-containing protein
VSDPSIEPAPEEAERWLAKAAGDLAVANLILQNPIGANWAACFHAQQAAEKSIKALLVAYGIDFPMTHTLERLAGLLAPDAAGHLDQGALQALTPWAVAGRYPEDIADPSIAVTSNLVAGAATIIESAHRLMKQQRRS